METAKKKDSISEDEVSLLLHRYTATTILTLLQEVSQHAGAKIDWRTIVKRSSTGITSAREYQMLWRHLAYRDMLLEKIDDGAEPLDDESDLEYELKAVPTPSEEALSEAAACVKVLMSSGSSHESASTHRTNLEALLSQNIPHEHMSRVPLEKRQLAHNSRSANNAGSVSDQKQLLGTSAEVLDGNGLAGSSAPPKKRRRPWTKEEDMELIAAVEKYGEGNWSDIPKDTFKPDRTHSQLSQRWATIRKRQASENQTSGSKTSSEEWKATQKAFSLAIGMPMPGGLSSSLSGGTNPTSQASLALSATLSDAKLTSGAPPLGQSQQAPPQPLSQKLVGTSNKSRPITKKQAAPHKVPVGANSLIQAAAFAAGGRIATPSTAASLMKAAQSKNAVHIRSPAGDPSTSLTNAKPLASSSIYGSQNLNGRCVQPATNTSTSAQPGELTCTLLNLSKHGAKQVAAVNDKANQQTFSTTTNVASEDRNEPDSATDDDFAIDVDELLTEDAKDVADTMDLDGAVEEQSGRCGIDEKDGECQRTLEKDQFEVNNITTCNDTRVDVQHDVDGLEKVLKKGPAAINMENVALSE